MPTSVANPHIMNYKMPQMYWAIMPDFKVDPAARYNFQFTYYQYVTLQFKENTEVWKTPANLSQHFNGLNTQS